jgi:filamentous hemagglutinin family protein
MKINLVIISTLIIRFPLLSAVFLLIEQGAIAQVIPDRTLSTPSQVRTSGSTAIITGGTTAGSNLFHSFSQFSVPSSTTAFFDNNLTVNNILARVTGGQFSLVNGLIKANGSANLFLINPNGIVFGPNASLNLGGSFVASTANSFNFADGLQYSAINPQAAPLLAVNVPVGLQYGKDTQPVNVIGSSLTVSPGKTLALVGGDVSLKGATLRARGGRIDLGGVSDAGIVGLSFKGAIPNINFSKDVAQGNVSLASSNLRVASSGGGDISVTARNIYISDNTSLGAGLLSSSRNKGGNIILSALDEITVEGGLIFNKLYEDVSGNGGDIEVATKSLSLKNGALIVSINAGIGNGGNINIGTTDAVTLDGADAQGYHSTILSQVEENAQGNGGNISISTKSLKLTEEVLIGTNLSGKGNAGDVNITVNSLFLNKGAILNSTNAGNGNGGNINIRATDSLTLRNAGANGFPSIILSDILKNSQGNGGDIFIFTNKLEQNNGASIANSTNGQGNSGNIFIMATDSIDIKRFGTNGSGSSIFLFTGNDSSGNGGDINISTGSLSVTDGGSILFAEGGTGTIGKIIINASDFIYLDGVGPLGGGISNTPISSAKGGSGDIILTTKSLRLSGGASISARQTGSQKTGNIDITATESVDISGVSQAGSPSRITSNTLTSLPSGDIKISTPALNIWNQDIGSLNRPGITATSGGTGNAGSITIDSGSVMLDGGEIDSRMGFDSIGNGGSITITANTLTALNGGNVRTSTFSTKGGDAGSIKLVLSDSLNLSGSRSGIFADTGLYSTGKGGNIFIDPPTVNISNGAAISVDSLGSGTGGSVDLWADSLALDNGTISATTASTNGGNVNLGVQNLLLANNNSTISATAGGSGNGGNLDINAGFIVLNNNSDIAANAFQGQGGNIQIATQGIFQSRDSTITASSDLGINGTVKLNVTDLDPSRGLFSLPETVVDASGLVAQKCDATVGKESQQSEFVVTGRGGLQPNPSESLQDDSILSNWVTLQPMPLSKPSSVTIAPSAQTTDTIAIAQGWKVDADGTVVLTAEPNSVSATAISTWQPAVKCRA